MVLCVKLLEKIFAKERIFVNGTNNCNSVAFSTRSHDLSGFLKQHSNV